MARENVTRFQLRDRRREGVDGIGTGHADDGEIDRRGLERDRLISAPAGVDEDPFPTGLDEEGERIAEDPVIDLARRQMLRRTLERRHAKDAIV